MAVCGLVLVIVATNVIMANNVIKAHNVVIEM